MKPLISYLKYSWRDRPIFLVFYTLLTLFLGFGSAIVVDDASQGPPFRDLRVGDEHLVHIYGRTLALAVDSDRYRQPCENAKALRQIMHFPSGADPNSNDFDLVTRILDDKPVIAPNGKHRFLVLMNLQIELPKMSEGAWYFRQYAYTGCHWWNMNEKPYQTQPLKAIIDAPPYPPIPTIH